MELGKLRKLSIPESKVYRRKNETWSIRTQSFCHENPKTGDINYGMIAHGKDMGIDMAIHVVIARLCYWHRAELSMHFFGRIGWENADGAPISKR